MIENCAKEHSSNFTASECHLKLRHLDSSNIVLAWQGYMSLLDEHGAWCKSPLIAVEKVRRTLSIQRRCTEETGESDAESSRLKRTESTYIVSFVGVVELESEWTRKCRRWILTLVANRLETLAISTMRIKALQPVPSSVLTHDCSNHQCPPAVALSQAVNLCHCTSA